MRANRLADSKAPKAFAGLKNLLAKVVQNVRAVVRR
jgi:hypothetical protein